MGAGGGVAPKIPSAICSSAASFVKPVSAATVAGSPSPAAFSIVARGAPKAALR